MSEQRTLIFDTETNGKRPKVRKGETPPLEAEPFVVQLAAKLFEGRRTVGQFACFCVPEYKGERARFPIDPMTGEIEAFFTNNGLNDAVIDSVGLPYRVALPAFNNLLRVCDRVVCHNIEFDDPVIRAAMSRIAAPQDVYWSKPKFCTMQSLTNVLKLPGKFGFKYPTLDEAYRALVDDKGFDGAHDAMVDVDACADVLWKIEDKDIPLWKLFERWPSNA